MKTLIMDGRKIELTNQQLQLFSALFNARGNALTTRQLSYSIYSDAEAGDDLIRQQLYKLRKKLEPTLFRIISQQWRGYWLSRLPEVVKVAT